MVSEETWEEYRQAVLGLEAVVVQVVWEHDGVAGKIRDWAELEREMYEWMRRVTVEARALAGMVRGVSGVGRHG